MFKRVQLRQAYNVLNSYASTRFEKERLLRNAKVTKFENNGLTLATNNAVFPYYSSVGLYLRFGLRHESKEEFGSCRFIEKNLLNYYTDNKEKDLSVKTEDNFADNVSSVTNRDFIFFYKMFYPRDLNYTIERFLVCINNMSLSQELNDNDVRGLEDIIKFENDIRRAHALNEHLLEIVHQKAFRNEGLGNSPLDLEKGAQINGSRILSFIKNNLKPENMILSVVGHEHEEVINTVNNHVENLSKFNTRDNIWIQNPRSSLINEKYNAYNKSDTYVGGIEIIGENHKLLQTNSSEMQNSYHTYCYLGVKGVPLNSKHYYEFALIQTLMGGGSSFSAGGPGKGMHSLLYLNILNQYGFFENCQFDLNCYMQSGGLFGISGSTFNKHKIYDTIYILLQNLISLTKPDVISDVSLTRAKNQLKHNYLMNLEYQQHLIEDMSTQAIVHNGIILDPNYICLDNVDKITQHDLCLATQELLDKEKFTMVLLDTNEPSTESLKKRIDSNLIHKIFAIFGLKISDL